MTPNQLLAACHAGDGGIGWEIEKSLRFRGSNLAFISRTYPANTDSSLFKKTINVWVKRGGLGTAAYQAIISNFSDASNYWWFGFDPSDRLYFYNTNGSSAGSGCNKISTQVFRDPSAWYNIQLVIDTPNTIAEDRVKVYVNGVRITQWTTNTNPSINTYNSWLAALGGPVTPRIGGYSNQAQYLEGYLAEIHVIDGLALTPSYFGQWSQESGQWVPIRYTGVYGTNGFYLDFKDNSALTNLGYDKSGLANHWTPNNFSLTSGATYDSMLDTPSNNYATINPFNATIDQGISGANLIINAYNQRRAAATLAVRSGKWYWEVTYSSTAGGYVGISPSGYNQRSLVATNLGTQSGEYSWNHVQQKYVNTVLSAYGAAVTNGDVVGVALDLDAGTLTFYKNGVSQGLHSSGITGEVVPVINGGFGEFFVGNLNFGQRPFAYTPPAGFKALCSKNLPTPSIKRGETGFDVATWTGNGGNIQVGEYQFPRPNYLIDKSLRFKGNASNTNYFYKLPTTGNQTTWTWSGWVKRTTLNDEALFSAAYGPTAAASLSFSNGGAILFNIPPTPTGSVFSTTRVIRDSNWHHVLFVFNTTNSVGLDRAICYVDGVRMSVTTGIIAQNTISNINQATHHGIGAAQTTAGAVGPFGGYMAEVHFIDGQALTPSSFGEQDVNGYWIPKAYTGTYGTNGFYLDFEDNSALANLGYDKSGNNNNWTTLGFSLTAGATYDSMVDSPTQNYAVLDPLAVFNGASTNIVTSNSGLTVTLSGSGAWSSIISSINTTDWLSSNGPYKNAVITSGKFYAEFTWAALGNGNSTAVECSNCLYYKDGTQLAGVAYGSAWAVNDVIAIKIDIDNLTVEFLKNNVSQGIQSLNMLDAYGFYIRIHLNGSTAPIVHANFGQRPFTYTPPAGFKTLSIPNIAEYTEDLESPDLVWIKCRNAAQNHMLFDSVRGATKYLSSNLTAAEATDVNSLISFNKNGFYLGNNANVNTLNNTYVAWMWKAGSVEVANNDGTIQSQVRANPALGFSVVKYTGTGANATVGHGLGITPKFVIIKRLGTTEVWTCWHNSLSTGTTVMLLNTSDAAYIPSTLSFTATPTSSALNLGQNGAVNSGSANNGFISYCFSEIEGFSKFGKYTGNGSADGPFVFCNGSPRFVLIKRIDAVSDWYIWDYDRDSINPLDAYLLADTSAAETGTLGIDILSNGFKLRSAVANVSAGTYIFAAFMQNPFKYNTAK